LRSDVALDALEQALHARPDVGELVHHGDRSVQYLSIRYTERLAEAGIEPSVGSVGDSYDNALAETIFGTSKRSSSRPSNGSTGSTIGGFSSRSGTFPRLSSRPSGLS
jgi:transposase InsO family protein